MDKSGSCAVFVLIVNDEMYVGNVGDSRAFLSSENGNKIVSLTTDHKPNQENETKRILDKGGKVYQSQTCAKSLNIPSLNTTLINQILLGPHRVSPGRLSVSRTFGDAAAKLSKFGGMEGVIVATPDVFKVKIKEDMDFLILGCK